MWKTRVNKCSMAKRIYLKVVWRCSCYLDVGWKYKTLVHHVIVMFVILELQITQWLILRCIGAHLYGWTVTDQLKLIGRFFQILNQLIATLIKNPLNFNVIYSGSVILAYIHLIQLKSLHRNTMTLLDWI